MIYQYKDPDSTTSIIMESKKLFFRGSLKCSFSDRNESVPKNGSWVVNMCFPENADLGKVLRHVDRKEIIHHTP